MKKILQPDQLLKAGFSMNDISGENKSGS